jgi:hypothetical protein
MLKRMPTCCLHSFANKGLREAFKPAAMGALHACETCGRHYRLQLVDKDEQYGVWREIVAPLTITEDDAQLDAADDPTLHEWAEDRCHWCGAYIGSGIRLLHLGICDACAEKRPN